MSYFNKHFRSGRLNFFFDYCRNAVRARKPAGVRPTKKQAKQKVEEPVILMLSSDEEDNAKDESMVNCLKYI